MAKSCSHWAWCTGGSESSLVRSDRLRQVTSSLPPSGTFPKLILVVGNRQRPPCSPRPKKRPDRLCLDLYDGEDEPLLIATTSLMPHCRTGIECCSPVDHVEVSSSRKEGQATLYAKLLYPFVDVFCFYAYQQRDLAKIADHVARWTQNNNSSIRPKSQPQLIIVLKSDSWQSSKDSLARDFKSLLDASTAPAFFDHFSALEFVKPSGSFDFFKEYARVQAAKVQEKKRQSGHLFSVQHVNCLFDRFLGKFEVSPPLSYLQVAREDFPVKPDRAKQIGSFVSLIETVADLRSFGTEVIASTMLLDQYPPGMHLFNPKEVFDQIYKPICLQIGKDTMGSQRRDGMLLPTVFSSLILGHFERLYSHLIEGNSSSSLHQGTLSKYNWSHIRSSDTCLVCLANVPQYMARCGHKYCEKCLMIFGTHGAEDPWKFSRRSCILCRQPAELTIRVRPPTAGQSILCIDGGGIRGVVPLMMLTSLQEQIDLPIPVQELFTLSYGTSVGALILLLLYMKGWSLERCIEEYETLAGKAFQPRSSYPIVKWAYSFMSDALYSSEGIEQALKEVCGNDSIAESSYAFETGVKFGILAASVAQPSICLFSNYNGVGDQRSGYHVPRGLEKVKAWEVGRISSAAPLYFSPRYLLGLDSFQDAGILQNNPIAIALSEFVALHGEDEPDVVLNLSCGNAPLPKLIDRRVRPLADKWPCRLGRAFMSLMDGARSWNDVSNARKKSPSNDGHYRLNITIPQPPALDDTSSIPSLKPLVCRDSELQETIRELSHRLFATLLYFELLEVPRRGNNEGSIRGRLLCSRKFPDPALPKILQRLARSVIIVNGRKASPSFSEDAHGNIYQDITMKGEMLRIEILEQGLHRSFPISGSPFRLHTVIRRSGLTTYFGNDVHKRKAVDDISRHETSKRPRL